MDLRILLRRAIRTAAVATAAAALAAPTKQNSLPPSLRVYVGTYTSGESRGIYVFDFDADSGTVVKGPGLAAASENPSFLAFHPSGPFLYAVNETRTFRGAPTGAVSAFGVDPASGALTPLNQRPSEGTDPCHLAVDREGRHVAVANYSSGSVAVLPVASDGRLQPASTVRRRAGSGPNRSRQNGPHAHQVAFDPSGEFLLSTDLGSDRIHVERFDAGTGALTTGDADGVALPPGSGPRHLVFHPTRRLVWAINELFCTVTGFHWDAGAGALAPFQTVSALPEGYSGDNKAAEIGVSPDGRFLYASNRGDDALMVFAIGDEGRLAPVGRVPTGGRTPRHFAIDPSGRWLLVANQGSGGVVVMRLDAATGFPAPAGAPIAVPDPACVAIAPPTAGAAP